MVIRGVSHSSDGSIHVKTRVKHIGLDIHLENKWLKRGKLKSNREFSPSMSDCIYATGI